LAVRSTMFLQAVLKNLASQPQSLIQRCYASFGKSTKPLSLKQFIPQMDVLPTGPRQNMYKGKALCRIAKHGLKTRLQTVGGKKIIWRNLLKGVHNYKRMYVAP
jgi:hypothetical protein